MSFWSTIAKVVPTLLSFGARLVGLKPGPEVEPLVLPHWYPEEYTPQWDAAGPDRCWWCLRKDVNHTKYTKPPCTRKRPSVVVELP